MSASFNKLDRIVQKWIYKQGWNLLRDIQNQSIPHILSANSDVVISASTAAGKTEAFFLPACSKIVGQEEESISILYISPLKALINDQYRRLESLCDMLKINVTPWHGDIPITKKKKLKKKPSGIILITPESLESMLIRNHGWVSKAFSSLKYIVIDEFHAFIGGERGQQLLSLITRLEHLLSENTHPIPRIALSATLGDLETIPRLLRPDKALGCKIISSNANQSTVQVLLKGYKELHNPPPQLKYIPQDFVISEELFRSFRGSSNLVFANSRNRTEFFANLLRELCYEQHVPNEFFPHHGSLAKELREEVEHRMQQSRLPTTTVCTMTLELGIDIGKVQSIGQVSPPHAVSSLRQRLGRSGRRGEPSILRMYIKENELSINSNIVDNLRLDLFQSIAMIRLLLIHKWYEPAEYSLLHLSTLLHQIFAIIAQWGGVRADQLYNQLCVTGPFSNISINDFKELLKHLGATNLISQLPNGELVMDIKGERLVNHYSFYSVFQTPEEYRIIHNGKSIGSIPIETTVLPGQHLIFGGQRWLIKDVDAEKKTITLDKSLGGNPPIFGGEGLSIHNRIRQEMRYIYMQGDNKILKDGKRLNYLDEGASSLFDEGLKTFHELNLGKEWIIQVGSSVYIIPWCGDKIINSLAVLMNKYGLVTASYKGVLEVDKTTKNNVLDILNKIISSPAVSNEELSYNVKDKIVEKFDYLLPDNLLCKNYGQLRFDSDGMYSLLRSHTINGK